MKITDEGMKFYEELLDHPIKGIPLRKQYDYREAFDWVEQNEGLPTIDSIILERSGWLTSDEFCTLSGTYAPRQLKQELTVFRDVLTELKSKEMIE